MICKLQAFLVSSAKHRYHKEGLSLAACTKAVCVAVGVFQDLARNRLLVRQQGFDELRGLRRKRRFHEALLRRAQFFVRVIFDNTCCTRHIKNIAAPSISRPLAVRTNRRLLQSRGEAHG